MKSRFQKKKLNILYKFNNINLDTSKKGTLDEPIIDLLNLINSNSELVTTSSCSGRISIFVESEMTQNIGGKGLGGQWLMVRHEPWDNVIEKFILKEIFGNYHIKTTHSNELIGGRLIHFKFEPMINPKILHILAETLSTARNFLTCALSSNFRESGLILSKKNIIIAVRSSIGFSCPIGYLRKEQDTEFIQLLVDETYLCLLIDMANKRFEENKKRRDMLYKNISDWIIDTSKVDMKTTIHS
ncbi:hypothetical protein PCK1_001287 [Pneumocystis canis]|nr:hypothetical protein PCK1_001287 [Pneumocystis canis]